MNKSEIKKLIESVDKLYFQRPSQIICTIYSGYATPPAIRAKNLMGFSTEQYDKIFCDRVNVGSVYQDKYPLGLDVNANMLKNALVELIKMKEENDDQEFTLDDLKTGMFVIEKNLLVYMVMDDTLLCIGSLGALDYESVSNTQLLKHFDKNTMKAKNPTCDIMSVYQPLDSKAKHPKCFIHHIENNMNMRFRYQKVFDRNTINQKRHIDSEIEKLQNQIQDLKERKAKL